MDRFIASDCFTYGTNVLPDLVVWVGVCVCVCVCVYTDRSRDCTVSWANNEEREREREWYTDFGGKGCKSESCLYIIVHELKMKNRPFSLNDLFVKRLLSVPHGLLLLPFTACGAGARSQRSPGGRGNSCRGDPRSGPRAGGDDAAGCGGCTGRGHETGSEGGSVGGAGREGNSRDPVGHPDRLPGRETSSVSELRMDGPGCRSSPTSSADWQNRVVRACHPRSRTRRVVHGPA